MPISHGDDIRNSFMAGINTLADAVRITLGPRGRNVALPQKENVYGADYGDEAAGNAPVLVTNDGVTIAKSITLEDAEQNMGAELLKEAAITANENAGDGTTTAIVLAQAVLAGAFKNIAAGADPLALRRGIQAACEALVEALRASAVAVESEEDIARVATISCQDAEQGALIGEALHRVGLEGMVNVDESTLVGGTMQYAPGENDTAAPTSGWGATVPVKTDAENERLIMALREAMLCAENR